MQSQIKPSITIITATYNSATTIGDCLTSVYSQLMAAEHIIVDGASSDHTVNIIEMLESQVNSIFPDNTMHTRIISEPDNGIYDAMNKGIRLATGDIIGILNSDDFYASADILAKVAEIFENPEIDACYGDLEYVREQRMENGERRTERHQGDQSLPVTIHHSSFTVVRYWKSGPYDREKFKWGWMPPHPAFFVRRSVYEKFGLFRLDMGSAADYELMLRFLYRHGVRTAYLPEVIVRMRVGGKSNATMANRLKANSMDRKAWEVNDLKPYPWTLWMKPLRKIPQWFASPPVDL